MDANLIYKKTPLGEEAMQNRSRLSARELRTILILVDGRSSVAELCEKTGNPKAVESGLDQLEQGGFIESIAGHASEHDLSKSSAQMAQIFEKAVSQSIEIPPLPDDPDYRPTSTGKPSQRRSSTGKKSSGKQPQGAVAARGEAQREEPHLGFDALPVSPPVLTDIIKTEGVSATPRVAPAPVAPAPAIATPAAEPAAAEVPPVVTPPAAVAPAAATPATAPAAIPPAPPPVAAVPPVASAAPVLAEPSAPPPPSVAGGPAAPPAPPPENEADLGPISIADLSASLNAGLGAAAASAGRSESLPSAEPASAEDDTMPGSRSAARAEVVNPFAVPDTAKADTTPAGRRSAPARSADEPARVVPLRPRRHIKLGWRGALAIVGGLLLLGIIVVVVFPVASYRGDMEALLSRSVGQPVSIGAVRSSLAPLPVLILENVKVGRSGDLTIREVRATPQPLSLFGHRKVFRSIDLSGVNVPVERLGILAAAVNGIGAGSSDALVVHRMKFDGITFAIRDLIVQEFSGLAEMDDEGKLKKFALGKADDTLRIGLQGQGEGAAVTIEGNNWKPAEGSPYVFEALSIQGTLAGSSFTADKIEGRLLGGVMNGKLHFDWSKEMALDGSVGSDFMPTKAFVTALGSPLSIDGEINGRLRFKAAAPTWADLVARFPIEGDFVAKKGIVTGMDLVESVRRAGKVAYRGGLTKFDQITGRFNFDGQTLQLSALDVSSGVVHAGGRLAIGKGQELSGNLDVLLRGTAVGTRMPVAVSGNLKEPVLTAGRR